MSERSQDGRGVGRCEVHTALSTGVSGTYLQMQRIPQSTSRELAAGPDHWKGNTHGLGAGGQRLKSNPRMSTAADCRETVQGDRRKEAAVGTAFRRNAGQPCRQGATAESCTEGACSLSLPAWQGQQPTNADRLQTGWPFE